MAKARGKAKNPAADGQEAVRERILEAAFAAFREKGYADTSTLEIATRARVSKRELYALVGNKEEMVIACIAERAAQLKAPVDLPAVSDRETLEQVLVAVGTRLLRIVSDPAVVGMFRLAIGGAAHAPEVARALDSIGIEARRALFREIMSRAKAAKLLDGRPEDLDEQFYALLWGDLMIRLLLGMEEQPGERTLAERARKAAAAFLQLHPAPFPH